MYCNSLIRETGATPSLDAEEMNSIKQLLTSGQREQAIQRFQELSGLDAEQAQRTIDEMGADLSIKAVFNQQLTRSGKVQVMLSVIIIPASLLAYQRGVLSLWITLICVALAGFTLFVFGRAALTTLRYWNAPVAKATTLHYTQIGTAMRNGWRVHTFLFLLKIQPKEMRIISSDVCYHWKTSCCGIT